MFRSKKRTAAAWAKGLMLGKAVGARDERDRIIKVLQDEFYPLDYMRWQADELMDEIFALLRGVDK